MLRRSLIGSTAIALVALPAFAQETRRVRGTVEKGDGSKFTVKLPDGSPLEISVIGDKPVYTALVKAELAELKPGAYIGVTSLPQPDGTLKAVAIHFFPDAARGAGEGHRAWDQQPNSMMTNATIDTVVTGVDGPALTVKYRNGEKKVLVSPQTSIVRMVQGTAADIKPGTKVIIFLASNPGPGWETQRVTYGKDGLTPPM